MYVSRCLSLLRWQQPLWWSKTSRASIGNVSKSDLAGAWQGVFFGDTGCGTSTEVFDFTPNANGSGTANATYHTAGCGDGTALGLPITITSLNANGSGTANLSCGTGCGFNFSIQVSPDRSTFNLVDVSDPETTCKEPPSTSNPLEP